MLDQIERLDAALERVGESVIVRRYSANGSTTEVETVAMIRQLSGQEIRSGSSGTQLTGRAVLSPTGLEALLPLRTTDKLVRNGQERSIGWVDNKRMAANFIRITADFQG